MPKEVLFQGYKDSSAYEIQKTTGIMLMIQVTLISLQCRKIIWQCSICLLIIFHLVYYCAPSYNHKVKEKYENKKS